MSHYIKINSFFSFLKTMFSPLLRHRPIIIIIISMINIIIWVIGIPVIPILTELVCCSSPYFWVISLFSTYTISIICFVC